MVWSADQSQLVVAMASGVGYDDDLFSVILIDLEHESLRVLIPDGEACYRPIQWLDEAVVVLQEFPQTGIEEIFWQLNITTGELTYVPAE